MNLRTALRNLLGGWERDLPAAWRKAIGETQLNWRSRALDRPWQPGEIIFPGRKGAPLPSAPEGAHLLRAFSKIHRASVRAVIVGQDPYPNVAWATGCAFEQGDLIEWPDHPRPIAASLRRIVQLLIAARTQNRAYAANDRAWLQLIQDSQEGRFRLESPRELFDRLAAEGVLFLNTSLTVSIFKRNGRKESHGHFQLWAPFTHRVLSSIAGRQTGHVVFLLLGRHAERIFDRSKAQTAAESAGAWKTRVDVVRHCHPAAIDARGSAFLRPPNPFSAANDALERMGATRIRW